MARVVLASEHQTSATCLVRFQSYARRLARDGHAVHVLLSQLTQAEQYLPPEVVFLQAPYQRTPSQRPHAPRTYSDLLLDNGWRTVDVLSGLLRSWRALLENLETEVLVAEAAPTAVAAAHALCGRVATVGVGSGWSIPPHCAPFPALAYWVGLADAERAALDAQALANLSEALQSPQLASCTESVEPSSSELPTRHGSATAALSAAVAPRVAIVATHPTLDPYREHRRENDRHVGFTPSSSAEEPEWHAPGGWPRIFASLHRASKHFEPTMNALSKVEASSLVVAHGASDAEAARWSRPTCLVRTAPIRAEAIADQCQLAIGHGEAFAPFLVAGVPLLFLPRTHEETVTGRLLYDAKAAYVIGEGARTDYAKTIARALTDSGLREGAQRFASQGLSLDDGATAVAAAVQASVTSTSRLP